MKLTLAEKIMVAISVRSGVYGLYYKIIYFIR